ncbi:RNA polymerase III subunit RPC82-domain-containing protein [Echria macrotheca]|uniref:DNA-directed RNA polymerase III subunit RPC3 n=1 Tax=Echria macrotheca TaxID=438768 RepID=A0AAJ0BMX4_9PEZI|nr:RNA polymerase III subunit RPC82-domain-containing protein [Echria macrotheca]
MHVTQNAAELCSLLVDEFHGELPSRIYSTLLMRGKSSIQQLCQYTLMTPRQLRHGLAVLHQFNLLFNQVEDNGMTLYEANPDHTYNLVRAGRILEMVETSFGPAGKDVMQSLFTSGQTRISDLVTAYQGKSGRANGLSKQFDDEDDEDNKANGMNGAPSQSKKLEGPVKSTAELNSILCRLVEAELIDVVHRRTFISPEGILKAVDKEVTDKFFPNGVKGGKGKIEHKQHIGEALRSIRGESKSLKRKLEQNGPAAKRRKLFANGISSNGFSNGVHDDEVDPALDAKQVVRINYEKCLVDLRNRRLVQFVTELIGDITAYVYGVLLHLLTKRIPRCRLDATMDLDQDGQETDQQGPVFVTTAELLDQLKTSIDLSQGLGKTSAQDIATKAAEKISEHPPKPKLWIEETEVDGEASEDESDDDNESDTGYDADYKPAVNGTRVKFADGVAPKEQRLDRTGQLRQHLLLLSNSAQGFVRHCGHDEWTVDFAPLMKVLREAELDSTIERTSGRDGMRLVRILRDKGKLDEKALHSIALMRKPDVQKKMTEMLKAGFVHVQEVPRDNKADVKKSIFLWFCDTDMSFKKITDNCYRAMVRCIQTLEVLRQNEQEVLMLTRRTDVKGREKDVMREEYYERYARFQDNERKLFAQVMRLDDLVALLRDF